MTLELSAPSLENHVNIANSDPAQSLAVPITNDNRPRNSRLEISTSPQNPRKAFPAGALMQTYLDIIEMVWMEEDVLPEVPWIRGCISNWLCTYYHFGDRPHPPLGTTAWAVISVLSEEFRLNTEPHSARWAVEHWTYFVDGQLVTDISNNFPDEIDAASFSGVPPANSTQRRSALSQLPETIETLTFTATDIPLRSVLFLLSDLHVRFFFGIPYTNPLAPLEGYTWQTLRDPATGAKITLEILDTAPPPGFEQETIKVDDLYYSFKWRILSEWTGGYEEEESHQHGWIATFRIEGAATDYARITLDVAAEETADGDVLNEDTWTGGSWLDKDPPGGVPLGAQGVEVSK